jgi:hypothetical protein
VYLEENIKQEGMTN